MGRMRPKKEDVMRVPCPTCGAHAGEACVRRLTKRAHQARPYTHPERRRAAAWIAVKRQQLGLP